MLVKPVPDLGSSPHTWGIRALVLCSCCGFRFIPTYVGHIKNSIDGAAPKTVHPHIRGAYFNFWAAALMSTGSSPHTWGIWHSLPSDTLIPRFIPTYVGHMYAAGRVGSRPAGSSPHTWGICRLILSMRGKGGSSPHTWGISIGAYKSHSLTRFIPTYVGHMAAEMDGATYISVHPHIRGAYYHPPGAYHRPPLVHPHIRGAYQHPPPAATWQFGSSPHTWGISANHWGATDSGRFIPTYVGHMAGRAGEPVRYMVHPHIRGAYHKGGDLMVVKRGSSPHTWGICNHICNGLGQLRFIPTYVGHITSCTRSHRPASVHPHIRGAYR